MSQNACPHHRVMAQSSLLQDRLAWNRSCVAATSDGIPTADIAPRPLIVRNVESPSGSMSHCVSAIGLSWAPVESVWSPQNVLSRDSDGQTSVAHYYLTIDRFRCMAYGMLALSDRP